MRHFDIIQFLERHGVAYITHGANVGRGNVNIKCPFCGSADPSYHMGIQLERPHHWGCWRDEAHRGKRLHRLLIAVGRISYAEAQTLLGDNAPRVFDATAWQGLSDDLASLWEDDNDAATKDAVLEFPEEFQYLDNGKMSSRRFVDYLCGRGFREQHLSELVDRYGLRYAISGDYKDRLIFPVIMGSTLVAWTGRSIWKESYIRYKSTPKEEAPVNIFDSIYLFDSLMETGGQTLFVTEGPMDALKVDFYSRGCGNRATCLFSKILSEEQKFYLQELSGRFDKIRILLDPEELGDMIKMERAMAFLPDIGYTVLPEGIEDPGALTPRQVKLLGASL